MPKPMNPRSGTSRKVTDGLKICNNGIPKIFLRIFCLRSDRELSIYDNGIRWAVLTMGKTNGAEQKTLQSDAKRDQAQNFRTSTPRDRRTGSNHNQPTHYETGCVDTGNHREPHRFRVAEQTQNSQLSEQPGHSTEKIKY